MIYLIVKYLHIFDKINFDYSKWPAHKNSMIISQKLFMCSVYIYYIVRLIKIKEKMIHVQCNTLKILQKKKY